MVWWTAQSPENRCSSSIIRLNFLLLSLFHKKAWLTIQVLLKFNNLVVLSVYNSLFPTPFICLQPIFFTRIPIVSETKQFASFLFYPTALTFSFLFHGTYIVLIVWWFYTTLSRLESPHNNQYESLYYFAWERLVGLQRELESERAWDGYIFPPTIRPLLQKST